MLNYTYIYYYGVMATHLTTIVLLCHHPEDGRITGRNMFVSIFWKKIHNEIKSDLLVVDTFYKLINAGNIGITKKNTGLSSHVEIKFSLLLEILDSTTK